MIQDILNIIVEVLPIESSQKLFSKSATISLMTLLGYGLLLFFFMLFFFLFFYNMMRKEVGLIPSKLRDAAMGMFPEEGKRRK